MKRKILFLQPSQKPVEKVAEKNMFYHMSSKFEGDAISYLVTMVESVNEQNIKEINALLPAFTYHARNRSRLPRLLGLLVENFYLLRKGIKLCRKNKYDVIVAHNTALSGVIALILRSIFGGKVIVDTPTHPYRFYTQAGKKMSIFNFLKLKGTAILGSYVTNRCDMNKLVYPGQIDDVPNFTPKKHSSFGNFVPVKYISQYQTDTIDKTILLVGTPWYIKGYDILIKAFDIIADKYPDYTVHIIGGCSAKTKEHLKSLTNHKPQVHIHERLHNDKVIEMMARCSIYINASRTEALARVFREAMALKKPVIASNVDGTPYIINDGITGMLFENENPQDLAGKISYLIQHPGKARELAENGYKVALTQYSEDAFVENYSRMVEETLSE